MNIFNKYSAFYDLLYSEKPYSKEVDYINELIKKYSIRKVSTILDVGCGTGIHASYLLKKGFNVTGIDFSSEMIKIARKKEKYQLQFIEGDIRNITLRKKFDVILSLFHVISYQISNTDLQKSFSSISKHLKKEALFIFDCWYGPAVLTNKPAVRIKRLENNTTKFLRIAEPILYPSENIVDVNYEVIVENKESKKCDHVFETHKMRYLYMPEVRSLLDNNGLEFISSEEWLTGKESGFDTWGVCFISRKK